MPRVLQALIAILFGVTPSNREGVEEAIAFDHPKWMSWDLSGGMSLTPSGVNVVMILAAILLVVLIYRRDGRRPSARIGLGILRALIFAYVIMLINRPVLQVSVQRVEPSVLAIMIDDSISMMVRDTGDTAGLARTPTSQPTTGPASGEASELIGGTGPTRMDVATGLLSGNDSQLIRKLSETHALRFYRFSKDAQAFGSIAPPDPKVAKGGPDLRPINAALNKELATMLPQGGETQLVPSLLTVLGDLQGQRIAGIVLLTDARETPVSAPAALVDRFKKFGVKVYPIAVGKETPLKNIAITTLTIQDSAFKDDIVSAKVGVRASGYEGDKSIKVRLRDKKTNAILRMPDGRDAEAVATVTGDRSTEVEINFQPKEIGTLDVVAEVDVEEGELNAADNKATESVAVLDAKVNVLYVDGYPRWEYRYIKNEMIRDRTINISCLLTSADPNFPQEGDRPIPDLGPNNPETGSVFPGPITRFPETREELRKYDVVLFGDLDPRQFTDLQLKMVVDFVSEEAGGFGMLAGPQHAPAKYRNTSLESVLPVQLANVIVDEPDRLIRDGWRPVITDEGRRGEAAMIFRFFPDKEKNDKYIREDLQPLFWYSRGLTAKNGVGRVYAEHPIDTDPTGRKAPLLVLGRFGAGRTLFSAIDDSWRWRYYTGESVFDTYWVQQIRYLARGRKLAERGIKFTTDREKYERGQPVKISLTVLSPQLLQTLKDQPPIQVDVLDDGGQVVRHVELVRQETPDNVYTASFEATDKFGSYSVRLPALASKTQEQLRAYQVIVPRLELEKPEVDRASLTRLAPPERIIPINEAREKLPGLIQSAAKISLDPQSYRLLDTAWKLKLGDLTIPIPRAIVFFMLLLTTEWVLRKVFGML